MKMSDIFENKFKFKHDYKWPKPKKERECTQFHHLLDLAYDSPS